MGPSRSSWKFDYYLIILPRALEVVMHPRPSFYKPTLSYRCVINLCNTLLPRVLSLYLLWNKSVTSPNLCNLASLAKTTAVWGKWDMHCPVPGSTTRLLPLIWEAGTRLTDLFGLGHSWVQTAQGGREKPLTGLHFLKGAKHELASSWRNAGTDLLILLSLSEWENWLSGREGAVETEEQHFEFRIGHNHQASGTRRKHTLLSFTNVVLYEG